MSESFRLHGLQHTKLPCLSPLPRAWSNSCPSRLWYHAIISSSVIPFSSCLQSFPASGSFQMNQFFTSGGQSIEVSASASVAYNGCSLSTFRPMSQGQCWPCPPLFPTQLMSRASPTSVEAWVPLGGQGWEQWVSTCLPDPVGKTKIGGVCFMIQGAFWRTQTLQAELVSELTGVCLATNTAP